MEFQDLVNTLGQVTFQDLVNTLGQAPFIASMALLAVRFGMEVLVKVFDSRSAFYRKKNKELSAGLEKLDAEKKEVDLKYAPRRAAVEDLKQVVQEERALAGALSNRRATLEGIRKRMEKVVDRLAGPEAHGRKEIKSSRKISEAVHSLVRPTRKEAAARREGPSSMRREGRGQR